jgi:hypothetical protein
MATSPKGGRCPFHLGQSRTVAVVAKLTFDRLLRSGISRIRARRA